MPKVTLLAKAHNSEQMRYVDKFLKDKIRGLKCESKITGSTDRGWVQADIQGEDENVAVKYIESELGLCPSSLKVVERFSTVKGHIIDLRKNPESLKVDIGVFQPEIFDVSIPLQMLQAQLCDGRKLALDKIVRIFGLIENLPFTVKVTEVDVEARRIDGMLPEVQLGLFRTWITSLLDRLLVLGATSNQIASTMHGTDLDRDVLSVESLGLFEHAITCKFDTDAAGLIPIIGRSLHDASFEVFSGKRILGLLPGDMSWLSS